MTDEQYFKLMEGHPDYPPSEGWTWHRHPTDGHELGVRSLSKDPNYPKCPRCWHYTHDGITNYDSLCDRCCRILLDRYPDHDSVPHIKQNWKTQGFRTDPLGVDE
jgi:hypothetical protein